LDQGAHGPARAPADSRHGGGGAVRGARDTLAYIRNEPAGTLGNIMTNANACPGRARGVTLVGLLVVVVIIGILAAAIVPRIMDRPDQARVTAARADIAAIIAALKLYKLDNGTYPRTELGLAALEKKPERGNIPRQWNQHIHDKL